jgi:hypothetical protein
MQRVKRRETGVKRREKGEEKRKNGERRAQEGIERGRGKGENEEEIKKKDGRKKNGNGERGRKCTMKWGSEKGEEKNEKGERKREKEKEIMPSGKVLTEERESNLEGKERGNDGGDLKIIEEKGDDRRIWRMEAGLEDERKNYDLKRGMWKYVIIERLNMYSVYKKRVLTRTQ